MDKYLLPVVDQQPVAKGIYRLVLEGSAMKEQPAPGQFFHIRCGEGTSLTLRRPISLCDWEEGRLHLMYRVEGEGTRWLSQRRPGEVLDLLGPLGTGFPLYPQEEALLIGGGIGIPPLFYLAKEITRHGGSVTAILGYADRERSFLWQEFARLGRVVLASEDGSLGFRGRVTDALAADRPNLARVKVYYSCGPTAMLRAVQQELKERPLPSLTQGYLSLEERMGCGVGACFACFLPAKEDAQGRRYRKICSDGPVFSAEEILL